MANETAALEKFCASPFWDLDVTWNTWNPDFTLCFQKTVLTCTPCLFLWLFTPLEIYYAKSSKQKQIPWNVYNITKLVLTVSLSGLAVADLSLAIHGFIQGQDVYVVDICAPLIKLPTFVISAFLVAYSRLKGLRSSGVQFLFWLLSLVCGIPGLRQAVFNPQTYQAITFFCYYSGAVFVFLLNCCADRPPTFPAPNKKQCPDQGPAGFLSRILFWWFTPLVWTGFRRPLSAEDLWDLPPENTSSVAVEKFELFWTNAVQRVKNLSQYPRASYKSTSATVDFVTSGLAKQVSVVPSLCRAFAPTFVFGAALKLAQDLLTFASPQILKLLITFIQKPDHRWKGYLYAFALFGIATLQTLISTQYTHRMYLVGMRVRTALISAIYKKTLNVSNAAKNQRTAGEIINLTAVDSQQFVELMPYVNLIWSAPLQIILCLYFLWDLLGVAVLAGVATMVILIPINGFITKRAQALQVRQMQNKDERIKILNETLNGIKVLKMYAWEPCFEGRIGKIRSKEIGTLKKAAYFNAGMSFVWSCAPFLVALLTFVTFIQISDENVLTPQIAFVALTLFSTLHFVMGVLPLVVVWMIETRVSVKRINDFLNCEELDPSNVQHYETEKDPLIMEKGTFAWDDSPALKNANIRFERNSLTAVIGGVGAGKTTLISALLGETCKRSGRVNTTGSIAYVSQKPWIQNVTVRDNILFGRTFDKVLYDRVLQACDLDVDLRAFPAGDLTEIGERGANISGGQKQRVALARAVYASADVYLLDDVLSAVDANVAKRIFERVIGPKGLLRHTTRVFVTHGISFLPFVDKIVAVKNGEIAETGTYKELVEKKSEFSESLAQYAEGVDERDTEQNTEPIDDSVKQTSNENAELIKDETTETGSVKWSVYAYYLKSVGVYVATSAILLMVLFQVCNVGSNIWLSMWSVDQEIDKEKRDWYLGVYGTLGAGQALTTFLAAFAIFVGCLNGAHSLHNALLTNVLHAPCNTFFDVTPVGRIMNRFSKDVDTLDMNMPMLIRGWMNCFFAVVSTLFVISYTTPIFVTVLIPIAFVYYLLQRIYIKTSRQLKRLEAVSRSPIYTHFSETLDGSACIRAYGSTQRFIDVLHRKVDDNQACCFYSRVANRWLSVWLEMIGNVIILCAALLAVLGEDRDAGLVGLSITYALQITQSLNWLVVSTSELETDIVSVERIKEYTDIPSEAPLENSNKTVPTTWPEMGTIEFRDFALRYRPGLGYALKNLNLRIRGGEKVGIVGRTGAGKSSLTISLFRIVEPALGEITIDNLNISEIGLHSLRSRLTIIPQDAILFAGSLRFNLDPYELHADDAIWKALELAHLQDFVKGQTGGLNLEVTEGGNNFSVGQRQLVCVARAILRKSRVLVLDEATASVDLQTDELIQRTIREVFSECTVVTIAHRLNTVMNSDRVMVLVDGQVAEFDSPLELLQKEESVFRSMAKDAGIL